MRTRLHTPSLDRMRAVMRRHVERDVEAGGVPGMVTCVYRRGGEAHVDAFGVSSAGGNAPVARDTIFRIASMTKPVTAVAALILVEECRLHLDDPVDDLLPELARPRVLRTMNAPLDDTVPARRSITTRDLLTFCCGHGLVMAPPGTCPYADALFSDAIGQGPPHPAKMPAPDEWLARLRALPLACQPGERWLYNTGADILGVLIERAAGVSLERFMRERIFDPLGMRDTGFHVPADKRARFTTCTGTSFTTGKPELYDDVDGEWSRPPKLHLGGAGLVSTADDFLTFARMLLEGGSLEGARVLSRPFVELMTSDQLTPAVKAASAASLTPGMWDDNGWGFGVSVTTRRTQPWSAGTYGWSGGLGSVWDNDPHAELVLLQLTNRAWPSPSPPAYIRDFVTAAYAAVV